MGNANYQVYKKGDKDEEQIVPSLFHPIVPFEQPKRRGSSTSESELILSVRKITNLLVVGNMGPFPPKIICGWHGKLLVSPLISSDNSTSWA